MELRMSQKERDRLRVMASLNEGQLKQKLAARQLGLSTRQVKRLLRRYRAEGDAGLVHRSRGRRSNRKLPDELRQKVLACLRRDYADFRPTFATEKLAERDGLAVSHETVRQWMMAEGLWSGRPKRETHRQWRERRECFGEMVQMDGSPHAWFEGRSPVEPVLLTLIDDATGRRMQRFYEYEGTEPALDLLERWLRQYGRMVDIYADKAGHLKVNRALTGAEARAGREAETQVTRALRELGIGYIPANSPQAKGRVERSHEMDQDRLVKELRLRGISTMEAANRYLEEEYTPQVNRRFAVAPASKVDAHRSLKGYDLKAILSVQEERVVANDYTIQYQRQKWQIERQSLGGGLRKSRILVEQRLDGTVKLRFKGRYLKAHRIPARQTPSPTSSGVSGRRPAADSGRSKGPAPAATRRPAYKPPADHPWRKYPKGTVLLCRKGDSSTLR
jgi:transposase